MTHAICTSATEKGQIWKKILDSFVEYYLQKGQNRKKIPSSPALLQCLPPSLWMICLDEGMLIRSDESICMMLYDFILNFDLMKLIDPVWLRTDHCSVFI
jgi:hypothetical protein